MSERPFAPLGGLTAGQVEAEERAQGEIIAGLPHLFGFKWYPWAREFFESRNKTNLLCAGNQISKSSTQIRKCVEWATNKSLWPELWPGMTPNQFWYLYPSQKVVDAEFLTKWSQFLPRGRFKSSKRHGWKTIKENSKVVGVQFFSGVTLFFKTYSQKVSDLQSGSVFALFCDEELPVNRFDEIMFRITATKGYFHMVFTATLGQEFWRQALEPMEGEVERLPGAWKRQISLYEAMEYEDGSASHWTLAEIEVLKSRCSTHEEVLRRVWGKFITPLEGRKYPSFDAKTAYIKPHRIPDDWEVYTGVDIGSGGQGHPSAIMFLAVAPDYTQGRFFKGWRGDNVGNTTAADVMEKYRAMKYEFQITPTRQFYDQACRDFRTIAERLHENFEPAEKSHEVGDEIINLLFKYGMVKLFDDDPELQKFGREIATIKKSTPKNKRKDDMVDAGRYAATQVPWNLDRIKSEHVEVAPATKEESGDERAARERKENAERFRRGDHQRASNVVEAEFRELNDLYEGR